MNWLERLRRLRALGVLGMNRRNAECILDLNPRSAFPVVDSKRRMAELCARLGVPTPALYGVVAAHSQLRALPALLAGRDDFVIKPERGAAGRGVLVVAGREGDAFLRHNGKKLDFSDVEQHVSEVISGMFSLGGHPDEALVQQRILPHPAFDALSYQGIPDVRVVLYKGVPAMAMLRLPTRASGGRANLHQGGVGAGVDLETGVTTRAILRGRSVTRHPDTGHPLVGFTVPHWPAILEMATRVAASVGLGYLGIDIVLDEAQGPLLLEGNARPGLAIQLANGRGLIPRFEEIDRALAGAPEPAPEPVPQVIPAPA